jgi:hypothetical protein
VVDQEVGDGIAQLAFRTFGIETLEGREVASVLQAFGTDRGEDRLPRDAHVQPGEVAARVERSGQLALGDRVIGPVQHVFFT